MIFEQKTKCSVYSDRVIMEMLTLRTPCPGFYGRTKWLSHIRNLVPCKVCSFEVRDEPNKNKD